ncbi:hypothetical protein GF371_00990 [Candidatus Woesearchaeota archaeon]|nr:hypothetical protein [Candidatus Woesearchaeota archaeon]
MMRRLMSGKRQRFKLPEAIAAEVFSRGFLDNKDRQYVTFPVRDLLRAKGDELAKNKQQLAQRILEGMQEGKCFIFNFEDFITKQSRRRFYTVRLLREDDDTFYFEKRYFHSPERHPDGEPQVIRYSLFGPDEFEKGAKDMVDILWKRMKPGKNYYDDIRGHWRFRKTRHFSDVEKFERLVNEKLLRKFTLNNYLTRNYN